MDFALSQSVYNAAETAERPGSYYATIFAAGKPGNVSINRLLVIKSSRQLSIQVIASNLAQQGSIRVWSYIFLGLYETFKGPSPLSGEGYMEIYQPGINEGCYNVIEGKGCHVMGISYLFGEEIKQNLEITEEEATFGQMYRKTYADIMKNKSSDVLASAYDGTWSTFSLGNDPQDSGRPLPAECALLTAMDAYGKFR